MPVRCVRGDLFLSYFFFFLNKREEQQKQANEGSRQTGQLAFVFALCNLVFSPLCVIQGVIFFYLVLCICIYTPQCLGVLVQSRRVVHPGVVETLNHRDVSFLTLPVLPTDSVDIMKLLMFALMVVAVVAENPLRTAIIEEVNAAHTTWTAGINNKFENQPMTYVRGLLGVKEGTLW